MSSFEHKIRRDHSPEGQDIFQPRSIEASFEMLATEYVLTLYQQIVRLSLSQNEEFNNEDIDDALEEWNYMTLCLESLPVPEDNLVHAKVLSDMRAGYIIKHKLPEDAPWGEIIASEISKFDQPIQIGLENNWPWEKVQQLYADNEHIESCLKHGADPSMSIGALTDLIKEAGWEAEMTSKWEEARASEGAKFMSKLLGLPEDSSMTEVVRILTLRVKVHLAKVWNRPPDDITDEEVENFLDNPF